MQNMISPQQWIVSTEMYFTVKEEINGNVYRPLARNEGIRPVWIDK